MPKPKSWSKKRLKEADGKFVEKKPDLDNFCKLYLDVLNEIAYTDDKQICSLWCEKVYSATPRVEIKLSPIGGDMIEEHALLVGENISLKDLNYLVKKANRLGMMNREIATVFEQEDIDGRHIYFEVDGLSPKHNPEETE